MAVFLIVELELQRSFLAMQLGARRLSPAVLESFVTKARDKGAALRFIKKALKRHGSPKAITTDGLRSYGAAMKELGKRASARWVAGPTTGRRTATSRYDDENGSCCGFVG